MLGAPVIAVLNLKGGVGKTTVTASVGRGLFDAKMRKVLLVDLDPQFNLTQALQSEVHYQEYLEANKTILSAFEPLPSTDLFRVRTSAAAPPPASIIEKTLRYYRKDSSKTLALIMGDFNLVKFALLTNDAKLNAAKTRFRHFIAAAREDAQVILLDCNPSSSFLTICALDAATDLLVPVRPDKYSVLGLNLLDRFVSKLRLGRTPKFHVLLNTTNR